MTVRIGFSVTHLSNDLAERPNLAEFCLIGRLDIFNSHNFPTGSTGISGRFRYKNANGTKRILL